VDSAFSGDQSVGVFPLEHEGRRLEAGFVAFGGLLHLDREAPALGPAQVHAQEDLGPVLGVGAAGTGVDRHQGIAGVVLTAEEAGLF